MKKTNVILLMLCITLRSFSQTLPKLYVNLLSHNEINNEFYDTNKADYDTAKKYIKQIQNIVVTRQAKWNYQTCSKFVLACIKWDTAGTSNYDLIQTMKNTGFIEIDPRPKTYLGNNISDCAHLIDSCGILSTKTLGGFLAYPYTSQDWTPYFATTTGSVYPSFNWKAQLMYGPGSPNHIKDFNNYGIWRPSAGTDSTAFHTHDLVNTNKMWLIGNGCAPVIYDTTSNVQWIVNLIRENLRKIQTGIWPANKFYSLTVNLNTRDFDSPGFVSKVQTVTDSIDAWVTNNKMVWATLTEKYAAFQAWSSSSGNAYSQLDCNVGLVAGTHEFQPEVNLMNIFPNPANDFLNISVNRIVNDNTLRIYNTIGQIAKEVTLDLSKNNCISISDLPAGIYFLKLENSIKKISKY